MQTMRSSNYQDMNKGVCNNYLKGVCQYGKDCRYRHPTKQKQGKDQLVVCTYFLQNKCKRGSECPFAHVMPKQEVSKRRYDWLTFCVYFQNGQCRSKDCRFLHMNEEEKKVFRATGQISPQVKEQAMCKALLQDGVLDGNTPACKDFLQGQCKWMSCPLLHLNRHEFAQTVSCVLLEKLEAVLGSKTNYRQNAGTYSSSKYQEGHTYDILPPFKSKFGYDSYKPIREKFASEDSHRSSYGPSYNWHDGKEDLDQQRYVSSESERIIKGIYDLMKEDGNLIRNAEKQEISDLRDKLNNLAEENARYRYEFSRLQPFEGASLLSSMPSKKDHEYQDLLIRLEKENIEMRRQLSGLQDQERRYNMGRLGSSVFGAHPLEQDQRMGDGMRGPSHLMYDARIGEDRRLYGGNVHGLQIPIANNLNKYNPLKQKVKHHLRQNMMQQYKKPQQIRPGPVQAKINYQKYQKPIHQGNKKTQQQSQKSQKSNQSQKKKPENQKPNEATASAKPKVVPKGKSDSEDNEAKAENGNESSVEDTRSEQDENDKSQETEAKDNETRSENNETGSSGKDEARSSENNEARSSENNEARSSENNEARSSENNETGSSESNEARSSENNGTGSSEYDSKSDVAEPRSDSHKDKDQEKVKEETKSVNIEAEVKEEISKDKKEAEEQAGGEQNAVANTSTVEERPEKTKKKDKKRKANNSEEKQKEENNAKEKE